VFVFVGSHLMPYGIFSATLTTGSLTQIFTRARILAAKLLDFLFHRIALGLRPAFLRSQSFEDSFGPLSPPIGQQRRVQTFATKKGAKATSRRRSGFGFLQDALLIFGGVGPPSGSGNYFWVRPCTGGRISAQFGCRSTTLRLASLAFAPFRDSQPPGERTPREFPFISFLFFLALFI
jgi:hypothetical protein